MLTDLPVLVVLTLMLLFTFCAGMFVVIIQIKMKALSFSYSVVAIGCFLWSYFIYYGLTVQTHAGAIFIK
jgi:hypothetical protein